MTSLQVEYDWNEAVQTSRREADGSASRRGSTGTVPIQHHVGNQALKRLCGDRVCDSVSVSQPNDPAEREARRVAEQVTRTGSSRTSRSPQTTQTDGDRVQRLCDRCRRRHREGKPLNCAECEAGLQARQADAVGDETSFDGVAQAVEEARKPGEPLPERTRTFFENRIVGDFSSVRVHTGSMADQAARSVNAKAYTFGSDIVFRSGEYRPDTKDGKRLLAHELAHVLQQRPQVTSSQHRSDQGQEIEGDSDVSGAAGTELEAPTQRSGKGQLKTLHRNPDDDRDAGVGGTDDLDAGVSSSSAAHGAFLDLQIECVIRKGGCSRMRPAGVPTSDEIESLDSECRRETGYSGPPVAVSDLECDAPGLGIAKSLNRAYPGWLDALPDCPCTVDEAKQSSEFEDWTSPTSSRLHPGAEYDFRSSGTTTAPGTNHGQQCTYDAAGELITQGAGAGTPDVWSPDGSFWRHYLIDFEPAQELSGTAYRKYWVPNTGDNCSAGGSEEESAETDVIELEPSRIEGNVYTVESGDTLWDIASEEYGDGRKWPVIFERNRKSPDNPEGIEDPNLIFPGQTLIIPPRSEADGFDRSEYTGPE